MTDDEELMAEIVKIGDTAAEQAPYTIDSLAAATTLADRFEHRDVKTIEEQIHAHFRGRGLFWRE